MTIEIQPEVETAIQQRIATGAFQNVSDLLSHALSAMGPISGEPKSTMELTEGQSLLVVFDRIRGLLTDEEVDTLFTRDPSPTRVIDLS